MKISELHLGCHGIPERCFTIRGKTMPFCARCMGSSFGHTAAAGCFLAGTLLPFYFSPIGLGLMYSDWHFQNKARMYHSNWMRFVTGIFGGYSVGLLIWSTVDWGFAYVLSLK